MKPLLRTVAFAGASLMAIGGSATAMHHEKAEAEIRAMFDKSTAEFNACDTSTVGDYNAEKRTGFIPVSSELQNWGTDEAIQEEIKFCEDGGKNEVAHEITEIVLLEGAAFVLGTGHYKRTEPDGAVSIDSDYTFTEIVVKTDDGWKYRHSHIGAVFAMEESDEEKGAEE